MAGKTLIGGTAYTIKGGKTLVGGTAYSIKKGKTLIGGTAYTISFGPEQTLRALLKDSTIMYKAGRNSSSNGQVSITIPNTAPGTYYIFGGYNGYWSISKVVKSSSTGYTSTSTLKRTATNNGNIYVNSNTISLSASGSSAVTIRGGTIMAIQFPNYTVSEADTLLNESTITRLAGRNSSSAAAVSSAASNFANKIGVIFYANAYIAFNAMDSSGNVSEVLFGNYSGNPSLLYKNGTTQYLSINGTSSTTTYGASIGTIV